MDKKPEKIKKTKEEYIFKKTRWMKVKKTVLWIILIYFFFRGIVTTFRPDQTAEVTEIVNQFRADFGNYRDQDAEIMSFAQNFVKEYLTYKSKDENDYKDRIKNFLNSAVYNMSGIMDLKGNAEAVYVQAYRKEEYSSTQYDVYVRAAVKYTIQTVTDGAGPSESRIEQKDIILKVPVYAKGGKYIIEDLPLFVNDDVKDADYSASSFSAKGITDDVTVVAIKDSLSNFLKAYYEQEQSVINYYLTKDAETGKFVGLNKRLLFDKIDSLHCYQADGSDNIICIVKIKVKDGVNDVTMYQQFNIIIIKNNNKYYVSDMNTKIVNLNIGKN